MWANAQRDGRDF